ncbi:hypothetical protein TIFTF001_022759 [Ficus carica]|uniref:carotenoid 9,10-dioxygenase n=1 Tax=Ficus carica TaxID=3494 RepID=A0AA88AJQ0_FICCA|nr:hypothetical protein TIFTF001_022759 [Ficus carica]
MYNSYQSHPHLSGNFGPVLHETPPTAAFPVSGSLPECLNGEFVWVGPNPRFDPVAGHHWFDGDGMVHGVRIKDGKVTYVYRYVKTSRLKQEEYFGAAKFMKIGDLKGLYGLLMFNNTNPERNVETNTALAYHRGKLLALHEGDKPFKHIKLFFFFIFQTTNNRTHDLNVEMSLKVLEDGNLQTIGMLDYDKRLEHSFTAHQKVDPFTGEMFTFGYAPMPPYVTYRVISKDGFMHDPVTITIPDPVMMHDFAITENYGILLMDLPMIFKPMEGDEVVLISCRLEKPDLEMLSGTIKENIENLKNDRE